MAPIAEWLRSTRERQVRADGEPWSQDDLLNAMRAEIGWAPHRPNYSRYETGHATPKPETLRKFVAFWATRDEPGPDLTPPPTVDPEPTVAASVTALVAELREWRTADRDRIAGLETLTAKLLSELQSAQERVARLEQRAHPESMGSGR